MVRLCQRYIECDRHALGDCFSIRSLSLLCVSLFYPEADVLNYSSKYSYCFASLARSIGSIYIDGFSSKSPV